MSIAGLHGRAICDPNSPVAFASCDRCNFRYNITSLKWQYDFRGSALMNLRILVCDRCYDEPFEFNRPIILPPDPVPILDARPGFYAQEEGPPPNPDSLQQFVDDIDGV